jgi:predicted metal-dependent peptidase
MTVKGDGEVGGGSGAPPGAGAPVQAHGEVAGVPGLAVARLWAAARFPYLATGLFGAQVIAAAEIGTVAVDDGWRLHADPVLIARWTPAQFGSVLVHHVSHLLRSHGERAGPAGVLPDQGRLWVRCADAEINDDLVPAGLDLPGTPVMPADLGAEDGLLAEQYFAAAAPLDHPLSRPGAAAGGWLDCGSGADGVPRPWDAVGGSRLSPWQARLLVRQVAQDCIRHAREAGNVPAGLLRWADAVLEPAVDWRKALAAELRRAVADTAGAVDYSYRRPSRRASVAGSVVLPALRRPVPEIAVVCDTSGSMTEDLLAAALAEVEGLLRAVGLARQVRVLACDTAVAPARRVSSARQVELVGGGGTDMGAGIAAADLLRPRPAITVVLTDGITPWPDRPPRGMRVVVGLLGEDAPDAPDWARAVRVPAG